MESIPKPKSLSATKLDVANEKHLKKLQNFAKRKRCPFVAISAITGEGIDKLLQLMRREFVKNPSEVIIKTYAELEYLAADTFDHAPHFGQLDPRMMAS